jgi:hypothetical protein
VAAGPAAVAAVVVAAAAGVGADMPWHRVPRPLRVLALAAAWFSYGAVLSNLNSLDDGDITAEVIWGACLFGYCISALVTSIRPALFSSADEFVTYRTALRTGNLPEEVDLPVWERRLSRSRLETVLRMWFAFPYLGFGALSADSSQTQYRVFLLCMFALSGIWVLTRVFMRTARIKQLESAVRQRQNRQRPEPVAPADKTMPSVERHWRSNAEAPMAERLLTTAVATTALAFVPLLLADLDSIVYSDSPLSHLAWIALCANATGLVVTGTVFLDPRMRATGQSIETILQYDRAFRIAELPDQFDVDQWRSWIKCDHRSNMVTLIWAGFYLIVGSWSVLSHPSGYHWVLAILLASLAIWQIRRWQCLCRLTTRLETQVERHSIRQLFG